MVAACPGSPRNFAPICWVGKGTFGWRKRPTFWRTLDEWLRRRLRAIQLRHRKRGAAMYRELLKLRAPASVAKQVAANSRRWWRNSAKLSNSVLTIAYFDRLNVPRLSWPRNGIVTTAYFDRRAFPVLITSTLEPPGPGTRIPGRVAGGGQFYWLLLLPIGASRMRRASVSGIVGEEVLHARVRTTCSSGHCRCRRGHRLARSAWLKLLLQVVYGENWWRAARVLSLGRRKLVPPTGIEPVSHA